MAGNVRLWPIVPVKEVLNVAKLSGSNALSLLFNDLERVGGLHHEYVRMAA